MEKKVINPSQGLRSQGNKTPVHNTKAKYTKRLLQ
jgi:hypothetical protein